MVYGRYNELVFMGFINQQTSLGGTILYPVVFFSDFICGPHLVQKCFILNAIHVATVTLMAPTGDGLAKQWAPQLDEISWFVSPTI